MVRTWALTIGLAVLWGSVCMGQQGYGTMTGDYWRYEAMAPAGLGGSTLNLPGLSFDQTSMNQTLAGVQANLGVFEQSSLDTGLPLNLTPNWSGLSALGEIQSGSDLQSTQMMTAIDLGSLLALPSGQSSNTTLSLPGLTISPITVGQTQGFSGPSLNR